MILHFLASSAYNRLGFSLLGEHSTGDPINTLYRGIRPIKHGLLNHELDVQQMVLANSVQLTYSIDQSVD